MSKKALKLLAVLLIAAVTVCAVALLPSRLCLPKGDGYIFYCGDSSANCREVRADANPSLVRLGLDSVCGECAEYASFDLSSFLDSVKGEIIFTEETGDSVNYYCTAALPYSVTLYGKKINLHISIRGDSAKAASPIIFGGY